MVAMKKMDAKEALIAMRSKKNMTESTLNMGGRTTNAFPEGVTDRPPPPRELPPKSKTIDPQTPLKKSNKKKVVEDAEEEGRKKGKKGVETTGQPVTAAFSDSLKNGRPINTTIQFDNADQKKKIAAQLAKGTEGDTSTVKEGDDKTIDNMTTSDMKAITARAPFSFNALRLRIGAN